MPSDIFEASGLTTRGAVGTRHQRLGSITVNTGGKLPGSGYLVKNQADYAVGSAGHDGPNPNITGHLTNNGNPYMRITAITGSWDSRFDDPTYYG